MNVLETRKKQGHVRHKKKDHTNPNPSVRLTAVGKLEDPETLIEVACHDDSPRVRLTAISRLGDDLHLEQVAREAESLDVRLVAVERMFSQRVVADLLKEPENVELIGMCFSKLSDRRIIESIAQDPDYSSTVRRMAVEYYADESYLSELEPEKPERKSPEAVQAFVDAYGGGIRGVRAIGRFKRSEKALRALGTIARQGGETGGLAVEYLCSALGSANPKLVDCAASELEQLRDPDLVDCVIRALDNPNLTKPIREMLRRIDTPEARAALGEAGSDN
jgi:hypothetical protein